MVPSGGSSVSGTTATVTGLTNGSSYTFEVTATDIYGQTSSASAPSGMLSDSGPNDQPLTQTGTVTSVASPAGTAFGQAVQAGATSANLAGPAGSTNAQGAVTGSAFAAECIFTPGSNSAYPSSMYLMGRPNDQWFIGSYGGTNELLVAWAPTTAGAFNYYIIPVSLTAGTTYRVAIDWNGINLYIFLNGTLEATESVTSVAAPNSAYGFQIFGGTQVVGNTVDEVRISNVVRNTTTYVPATTPFSSDSNTDDPYSLDTSVIPQIPQTVTFTSTAPISAAPGGPTYTATATGGGSGNPVTFASATTSVCTVSTATVSFVGGGTCIITANQAGNTTYAYAPQVQQSFTVAYAVPATPTGLATTASSSSVALTWNTVSSTSSAPVSGYIIDRSTTSATSGFSQIGTPSTNSYTDSPTSSNINYWYEVATTGAGGTSAFSSSVAGGYYTYSYTSGSQTFTVPSNVSSGAVTATVYGAQGGGSYGGDGGKVQATMAVTSGQAVTVLVGAQGTNNATSAFTGGGPGGYFIGTGGSYGSCTVGEKGNYGYGGGGYSGAYVNAGEQVIAGGGGGSGSAGYVSPSSGGAGGGNGSGANGSYNSSNTDSTTLKGSPGSGASQSAGGAAGANYSVLNYTSPAGGTSMQGGAGGITNDSYCEYNPGGGGGGGGGIYGGGGGGGDYEYGSGAGGGGGSGYATGVLSVTSSSGVQTGNGSVSISY